MRELYTRKGQMGRDRRFYAEYADALSDVPSYERVSLKGPIDQGWKRFKIQDLPGGVIKISRLPDKKNGERRG